MRLLASLLLVATACSAEPPAPPPAPATGGVDGAGGPPADPGAAPGPPPTEPGAAPADGAPPPPGQPTVPTLTVTPGEGVQLSGTVTYEGALSRPIRIDLLQKSELTPADSMGTVVHSSNVDKAGPWSVEVPKDLGPITVSFFVDIEGNGPSPTEPTALIEGVTVAAAPVTGLDATLSDPPGMVVPDPPIGMPEDKMGGAKGTDPSGQGGG